MHFVYVYRTADSMWHVTYYDALPVAPAWYHKLNVNYVDDVMEINDAIAALRSGWGLRTVTCDLNTIKCIIRKIVNAHTYGRASMWFMPTWIRHSLATLAHARPMLPRDCLREIAGWLQYDETVELLALFRRYVTLKYIRGLYARLVYKNGLGDCLRVTYLHSCKRRPTIRLKVEGSRKSVICDYERGPTHPAGRFNVIYSSKQLLPGDRAISLQFEAIDVIEFAHKRLSKRLSKRVGLPSG